MRWMKLLFTLSLIIMSLVVLPFGSALAVEESKVPKVVVGGKSVSLTNSLSPFISDNRVYLPIRALSKEIKANVDYDNKSKTVTFTNPSHRVTFIPGKKEALVDGKKKYLDAPTLLIKDTTMIPIRFLSEGLGYKVSWDAKNHTVYIETK